VALWRIGRLLPANRASPVSHTGGADAMADGQTTPFAKVPATHRHGQGQSRAVWFGHPALVPLWSVLENVQPNPAHSCATGRAGSARSMRRETSSTEPMPSISATSLACGSGRARQRLLQVDRNTALGGLRPVVVRTMRSLPSPRAQRSGWSRLEPVASSAARAGQPGRDAPDQLSSGTFRYRTRSKPVAIDAPAHRALGFAARCGEAVE